MSDHVHDWKKEYYGERCTICYLFYPDGSVPWDDIGEDDDDDPSVYRTCPSCGGEFWDGGMSGTCRGDEIVIIQPTGEDLQMEQFRREVCTAFAIPADMLISPRETHENQDRQG